jgi:pantetheine-phosphate adenylyltransferase
VVALGGTFDHLHAGHKILLSLGAWIAKRKLIVGVTGTSSLPSIPTRLMRKPTDDSLLQKKANKHILENIQKRMSRVRSFLALFRPEIIYDIVSINDVYGPTATDPDIQALVVSVETVSGAESGESLYFPLFSLFV